MRRATFRLALVGASLAAVVATLVLAASASADPSPMAITIPAGDSAKLYDAMFGSGATNCPDDSLAYGYELVVGSVVTSDVPSVDTHTGGQCNGGSSESAAPATIPQVTTTTSLLISLTDDACGSTYYSDGTGSGDNALVWQDNSLTYEVSLMDCDAPGGGEQEGGTRQPTGENEGNFNVYVLLQAPPPPTGGSVSISDPEPEQGEMLRAVPGGTWSPTTSSSTYEWQDCNLEDVCTDVGAGPTYVPGSGDVGDTIQVTVTAYNYTQTATATSAQTAPVSAETPTGGSVSISDPDPEQGEMLTAAPSGTWSPSGLSYTYQWQHCSGGDCTDVGTDPTYLLGSGDVGDTIQVIMTAHNFGATAIVTSAPTAPVSAETPTGGSVSISGTAQQGQMLTAAPSGTWSPSGLSYTYQWQHCSGGDCTDVGTDPTYLLGSGDVGDTIQVIMTAHNFGATSTATSAQTATVLIAAPVNTELPTIMGTPAQQGKVLTGTAGSWDYSPTSYGYQWLSCTPAHVCSDVGTPNSTTYTPVVGDIGNTIEFQVTAYNNGGHNTATSAATAAVLIAAPVNETPPVIAGASAAQQDVELSTSNGTWENSPTYTYQWDRCKDGTCGAISGAIASSYVPSQTDVGYTLEVIVTATNPGGHASATNAQTATVLIAAPVDSTLPTVSGTAQQGATLSATAGTWANSPATYMYQWEQCTAFGAACAPITGTAATMSSYVPGSTDVGHALVVVVTAYNAGGFGSATSFPTPVIAPPDYPGNSALPAITGTAQQGQSLSASDGTWTNSPTGYTYQWEDCDASGANCGSISDAKSSSYIAAPTDVGDTLRVIVTATNAAGRASATSAASAVVSVAPPAPTAVPAVSGTAVQSEPLSASTGSWKNSPTTYTSQWLQCDSTGANCTAIKGATSSSYVPGPGDAGHALRVTVTASNSSGESSATSFPTEAVPAVPAPATQINTPPPPPVLGTSTNLNPITGTILIKLPGTTNFVSVPVGTNVPVGSTVNALNGTVSITSALPNGTTQTGEFYDGEFVLTQSPSGTVVPVLTGGSFKGCPAPTKTGSRNDTARAAASKKKNKTTVVRQLWGNAHGNYTTKGRYGSASVSGTIWLVQDRCDGTYIEATKDNVFVIAYANPSKKYDIKQGQHILIPAPGF